MKSSRTNSQGTKQLVYIRSDIRNYHNHH